MEHRRRGSTARSTFESATETGIPLVGVGAGSQAKLVDPAASAGRLRSRRRVFEAVAQAEGAVVVRKSSPRNMSAGCSLLKEAALRAGWGSSRAMRDQPARITEAPSVPARPLFPRTFFTIQSIESVGVGAFCRWPERSARSRERALHDEFALRTGTGRGCPGESEDVAILDEEPPEAAGRGCCAQREGAATVCARTRIGRERGAGSFGVKMTV